MLWKSLSDLATVLLEGCYLWSWLSMAFSFLVRMSSVALESEVVRRAILWQVLIQKIGSPDELGDEMFILLLDG